ncbi:TIR domain-containing protein, partial [Deinococcus cellulosilyticus]
MAALPIEIIDLGTKYLSELKEATRLANSIQSDFLFSVADLDLKGYFAGDEEIYGVSALDETHKRLANEIRGYHPYVMLVTDKFLHGSQYSNAFCYLRGAGGIGITTTYEVKELFNNLSKNLNSISDNTTSIITSYFLYYFAKYALSFIQKDAKNHLDPRGCINDKKVQKVDIYKSMKREFLCRDCRTKLLSSTASSSQISSISLILEASGKIISKKGDDMETKETSPKVFIGSSLEGLRVAQQIQVNLQYDCISHIWNQNVFHFGDTVIERLNDILNNYDFGIFVYTPDDQIERRGNISTVARDNVIFETGLFMGRLSRERVFIVKSGDIQLPSDFGGLITVNL